MFIDSHAHISSDAFEKEEWASLIARAKDNGVTQIVNICSDLDALKNGIELAETFPEVSLAAACPPHDVSKIGDLFFEEFKKCTDKLVAVGETGLDYFYEHSDRETQKHHLDLYLREAIKLNLPVVIHCREAFEDFFSILDQVEGEMKQKIRGVLHCFTGTIEEAKELVKRGWFVSYSGIVTFNKSQELRETLPHVPLENIVIETDSPYLAPPPFRGKRNESSYLVSIAKLVAENKNVSLEEFAKQTTSNAKQLFALT